MSSTSIVSGSRTAARYDWGVCLLPQRIRFPLCYRFLLEDAFVARAAQGHQEQSKSGLEMEQWKTGAWQMEQSLLGMYTPPHDK